MLRCDALCRQQSDSMCEMPTDEVIALDHECLYVDHASKYAIFEYPPCRQRLRKTRRRQQLHIAFDPAERNSCLFSCFAWALGCESEHERYQMIIQLRDLTVYLWRATADVVLDLTLAETAALAGVRPANYLRGLRRQRWGGYREAFMLSRALRVPTSIWSPRGELLVHQPCGEAHPLHLVYTGAHYMVLAERPRRSMRWSEWMRSEWKALYLSGTGGMRASGNNAAAIRNRISQKVARAGGRRASQLVQKLWNLDESMVREIRGPGHHAIMKLAAKHQLVHGSSGWEKGEDTLFINDPWRQGQEDEKVKLGSSEKDDLIVLKSVFLNAKKEELPRRTVTELKQATRPFEGVTCVGQHEVAECVAKGREVSGAVVILNKGGLQPAPEGVNSKRIQVVFKHNSTSEWKTAVWSAYFIGEEVIEVALESVALELGENNIIGVTAELRELHCDENVFLEKILSQDQFSKIHEQLEFSYSMAPNSVEYSPYLVVMSLVIQHISSSCSIIKNGTTNFKYPRQFRWMEPFVGQSSRPQAF